MTEKHLKDIRVVSLDAGFTLIYPDPPVGHAYARIASRFGYEFPAGEIDTRFVETWKRHAGEIRDHKQNAMTDENRAYHWWRQIFSESLGSRVKPGDLEEMFDQVFTEYATGKYWAIYPDVIPTLEGLRERGFRLVVLSNWDSRLQRTLEELQLEEYFEKIYISTLIGRAKPDPGAFRYVLEDLNIPSEALLHVGDTPGEDIAGARGAGVKALLLDRNGKKGGVVPQSPTLSSLTELLE